MPMLEMVKLALPELLSVTLRALDAELFTCAPKAMVVVESARVPVGVGVGAGGGVTGAEATVKVRETDVAAE